MQTTMMRLPLSVSHLLERARQLFPSREVISRLPNRSLHRTTYDQVTEREAAVAAIQRPRWTERPLAVAVLKAGQSVEESELKAFLTGRFEKWQAPDDWAFVEAIPRSTTGKFHKAILREQFASLVSKTPA